MSRSLAFKKNLTISIVSCLMQFNDKSELFKKVRYSFYMLVVNDTIDTMSTK